MAIINQTAQLAKSAKADEIFVSNSYYRKLGQQTQTEFEQLDEIVAKNVGTIQEWKFSLDR